MKTSEERIIDIINTSDEAVNSVYKDSKLPKSEIERTKLEQRIEFLKIHLENAYDSLDWKDIVIKTQEEFYTKALEIKLK